MIWRFPRLRPWLDLQCVTSGIFSYTNTIIYGYDVSTDNFSLNRRWFDVSLDWDHVWIFSAWHQILACGFGVGSEIDAIVRYILLLIYILCIYIYIKSHLSPNPNPKTNPILILTIILYYQNQSLNINGIVLCSDLGRGSSYIIIIIIIFIFYWL